jgi:NitT/TauT family transport system substrate-binding protein
MMAHARSGLIRTLHAAAACAALALPVLAGAQEKVTFNMSWLPQGSAIGPIVAQDRGFYKEAGLDVNIVRGYGGNRTANELTRGSSSSATSIRSAWS